MKILALIGSPRKKGNTDLLVEQILKGARTKGFTTQKIYLYDYILSHCTDCRYCKKGDYVCGINDEMEQIYQLMEEAKVIVFGSPVYWYGPPAKMKMLLDRMRPYVENNKLRGKRAIVVAPAAEGPKACGPMVEMLRLSFDYIGIEFVGQVLVEAYEKGEIINNKKEMESAYELGASF
jgi:multimeric flavodoxin WrbA